MRATRAAGHDPFKATAIWPAAAATLLYLTALYAGKRIMAQRQPFDCKKQMLVYNVYQVCAASVCNSCVACNEVDSYSDRCSCFGSCARWPQAPKV